MSVTTIAVIGYGPGIGNAIFRECHLEWPYGGVFASPQAGPGTGPLTVSMWVRWEKPTNARAAAIAICTEGGPESLYLGSDESGLTPELFVGDRIQTTGQWPSLDTRWHHWGFISDGSLSSYYFDGQLSLQLLDVRNRFPFDRIVLFSSTAHAQFVGSLESVKIWQVAMTPTQLVAEANSNPPIIGSPYAYWPLPTARDLTDHSGNGRHMAASTILLQTGNGPGPNYGSIILRPPKLPIPLDPINPPGHT